jgi:hypothetical protein
MRVWLGVMEDVQVALEAAFRALIREILTWRAGFEGVVRTVELFI